MKISKLLCFGALLTLSVGAKASVIVLDFEGVESYPNNNTALIQDFYNGGTSSVGTSGTDYGIEFSANALGICLNTIGTTCSNTSRGGQGNPDSQLGALFFLTGADTFMNVAAGFDTGFSFFYAAVNNTGSVSVYDGLNGTGNLLASVNLSTTTSSCDAAYNAGFCPFVDIGVAFSGTAKSVSFAGVANQIVFDDITFGSATPDPESIPEPATLSILGLGLMAMGLRRRKS